MPSFTASAPGKIILFGEHAVVYHRPAIAVPVPDVHARAIVNPDPRGSPGKVHIQAPDIQLDQFLSNLPEDQPIAKAVWTLLKFLNLDQPPACTLRVTSTIPLAAGMGSGAAVSIAILRAFSAFLGHPLADEQVSMLAFEVEKIHHGTPSGIDNTVIAYAMPVFFQRRQNESPLIETFQVKAPFRLVIGDTGIPSRTADVVGEVRRAYQSDTHHYESLFDAVGARVLQARQAIESGDSRLLGHLMDENHELLCQIGVSSSELDRLVKAARSAGALGAKLSGAGRGGNMISLVTPENEEGVVQALLSNGASRVIRTTIGKQL
ncbi:MAG: mevalonate kinase [Omnitrophica WOR_2 bacterium]